MTYEQTIIAAVQRILPDTPQAIVLQLTKVLVDTLAGKTSQISDPGLVEALSNLQGKRLEVPQGDISIGNIDGHGIAIGHHATAQTATGTNILQVSGGSIAIVINQSPPRISPPPPFMAPTPPPDFVPRPQEFNQLLQYLLNEQRGITVASTVCLMGAGGFGKTTLAQILCHDQRVRAAFPDGVLWITLGENPRDLAGIIADLIEILTDQRPGFIGIDATTARLAEALGNRVLLLVIDDVWDNVHLRPFLQGGSRCIRLITTRDRSILPYGTRQVDVDTMQDNEALALLSTGIVKVEVNQHKLRTLVARLGEWPLLLRLANGFLRKRVQHGEALMAAVASLDERLDRYGLIAFDTRNPTERNQAVAATLGASFDLLAMEERIRYAELAIFPEDVDIPLATLARLWGSTGGYDALDTEELCERLSDLSLLLHYDLTARSIRLHDVIRRFLQHSHASQLVAWHVMLLDAHRPISGDWAEMPIDEPYMWQHLAEHLLDAGKDEEFVHLALSHDTFLDFMEGDVELKKRLDQMAPEKREYTERALVYHLVKAGDLERLDKLRRYIRIIKTSK
ncbi:MAG: NB-ARC domain-containing protein [Oscillochloridaceae bacterium umkhey_bin13]